MHTAQHNFTNGRKNELSYWHVFNTHNNCGEGFHTYGMDWNETGISFYYDDEFVYRFDTMGGWNYTTYMLYDVGVWDWLGVPSIE